MSGVSRDFLSTGAEEASQASKFLTSNKKPTPMTEEEYLITNPVKNPENFREVLKSLMNYTVSQSDTTPKHMLDVAMSMGPGVIKSFKPIVPVKQAAQQLARGKVWNFFQAREVAETQNVLNNLLENISDLARAKEFNPHAEEFATKKLAELIPFANKLEGYLKGQNKVRETLVGALKKRQKQVTGSDNIDTLLNWKPPGRLGDMPIREITKRGNEQNFRQKIYDWIEPLLSQKGD